MSTIEPREITKELKESYLDYAMSVIVARALPDIRDGLKPVHRRVLWTMWENNITAATKFRKSAYVTGETMGKYHPHGNLAIYDTIVRLAQDFSLRYPLIQGQGNFGCFTADTKVKLMDGRALSFADLADEYRRGKKNYTYTVNSAGLISVAEVLHPRITKRNAELVKVVLDSGAEIRCTPNHLFMLRNGTYKEAQLLTSDDSLMPLYQKTSSKTDRLNREGYTMVYQNKNDVWVPAHHLADNYNLTRGTYAISAGRVRHHVDFNKLNNNPDNIKRVQWGEHWRIHYEQASRQHTNEEYRKKIAEGRARYWSDPAHKAKKAREVSSRNLENWKRKEYRENMTAHLTATSRRYIENHPEKRKEFSERATQTLKRLWQDPSYRAVMHERIIRGNKNHTTNKTGKLKFINICREISKRQLVLSEQNYESIRGKVYPYGRAPMWKTGLETYFDGNLELARLEVNHNHRIIKIENCKEGEDVYDLTISGTHNFALEAGVFVHNSVDGDSAAAERYTEVRLARIAEEILTDIEKETVDWRENYDATRQEPTVLPSKIPNLLLNGTVGIAVGMATNIAPHNLGELADAILFLADNSDATSDDLMRFIKGPDFPTGGVIFDEKAIRAAYNSGRGGITTRAKADIEERKRPGESGRAGNFDIIVTEIPYQVNKAELIKQIAQLHQDKKIEGIRDIRDESDREGMRIVIELKADAPPQKVLNRLYEHTDLQKDFHLNMIALVNGIEPQLLSVKDILVAYLAHRKEMVKKRTQFDLKRAEERAHILEGLSTALSAIDKVIATIKKSRDRNDAHKNLVKIFGLSEIQANAILEMRLQTLAALEREKIEAELKEKLALIKELTLILKSPARILKIIKDEIVELKEKYGDPRRTAVVPTPLKAMSVEDLVPNEDAIITFSAGGYVKRLPPDTFKAQRRGGKGLIGSDVAEEDFLSQFFTAETHDNLLFFTDRGRVFQTKVYDIPVASRTSKGKAIHNFLELPTDEKISAIVSYAPKKQAGGFLIMVTQSGLIKKTPLEDFENIRRTGIIAIKLNKGDMLKWVRLSSGKDEVILTTRLGQSIRFKESQARPMGRAASGIRAMRLKKDDAVAGFDIISDGKANVLVVMANGFAKQTPLKDYRLQRRGGSGIKTAKVTPKTGHVVSAHIRNDETEIFALSAKGQMIRTNLESVRTTGRSAQGVKIMNLNPGDRLAGTVII